MVAGVVILTAAVASGLAFLSAGLSGLYGWALFIMVPFLIGFLPTALFALGPPRTLHFCHVAGFSVAGLVGMGFIILALEGMICLVLAAPLVAPFVALGTWTAFVLFHRHRLPRAGESALGVVLLTFAAITAEASIEKAKPPVYEIADSIVIDVAPSRAWQTIVSLDQVRPSDDWLFRAGAACPQRTKIVEPAVGGQRVCTLSTGVLMEEIDAWEPERRLAWRALSTPPPMKELNPFHDRVDAAHLHGYYRSVRGEFALEPAGPGRTRVTRRTWYEHDLYPSLYWRIWCDMAASKIHRFVLEEVRFAAEGDRV